MNRRRNTNINRRNNNKQRGRQRQAPKPKAVIVAAPPRRLTRRTTVRSKPTSIGNALRSAGSTVGSMLGFPSLGRAAGGIISRVFGQGDYSVNAPSSNSLMGQGPPTFGPLTSGFRIKHREYVTDVSSSVDFASTAYSINPGQSQMFPWLSSIAAHYEEYEIHGLVVYLNTTSGSAIGSTNTALGLWGCVTQYDPASNAFTDKQQCENYVGCQTTTPSQSLMHGVECKPRSNVLQRMYVRYSGQDIANEDLKFYDWGKLQVFTKGMQQAGVVLGEMFVSYDISFYKPKLPDAGLNAAVDLYTRNTCSVALPLGSSPVPNTGSNIGTQIVGGKQIVFLNKAKPGVYGVYAMWKSGAAALAGPSVTFQNMTTVNLFDNYTQFAFSAAQGGLAGATNHCQFWLVRKPPGLTGLTNSITFGTDGTFGTSPTVQVAVFAIPETLVPVTNVINSKLKMTEVELLRQFLRERYPGICAESLEEEKVDYREDSPDRGTISYDHI